MAAISVVRKKSLFFVSYQTFDKSISPTLVTRTSVYAIVRVVANNVPQKPAFSIPKHTLREPFLVRILDRPLAQKSLCVGKFFRKSFLGIPFFSLIVDSIGNSTVFLGFASVSSRVERVKRNTLISLRPVNNAKTPLMLRLCFPP